MISLNEIRDHLGIYGFHSSSTDAEKIRDYITLLLRWNRRLSLTTVTDPSDIVKFHFGESIFAAPLMNREGSLIDIGSGAGFPGLALAIALPNVAATLVESNIKKATFLAEVARDLALGNVEVFRGRIEEYDPSDGRAADTVTARAVGKFEDLVPWCREHLMTSGRAVLWVGGDDSTRIREVAGWHWNTPIQIPLSQNRFLLLGTPAD